MRRQIKYKACRSTLIDFGQELVDTIPIKVEIDGRFAPKLNKLKEKNQYINMLYIKDI